MSKRHLLIGLGAFFLGVFLAANTYAIPLITDVEINNFDTATQGSTSATIWIEVTAATENTDITNFWIKNGGDVGFGTGSNQVKQIAIYKDDDGDKVLDLTGSSTDTKLGQITLDDVDDTASKDVNITTTSISLGSTEDFFVVYNFGADVVVGDTAIMDIMAIQWDQITPSFNYNVDTGGASGNITEIVIPDSNIVNDGIVSYTFAPQGSSSPVLLLKVKSTLGDSEIDKITVSNTGSTVGFDNTDDAQIQNVSIFLDTNENNVFDSGSDTNLGTTSASGTEVVVDLSPNEILEVGESAGFFVIYELGQTVSIGAAGLGATMNADITNVQWSTNSAHTFDPVVATQTITASGIDIVSNDETFSFVLPGDEDMPMLRLSMTARGEQFKLGSITAQNSVSNFDMITFDTTGNAVITNKGVVTAKLWESTDTTFDSGSDTLVQKISNVEGDTSTLNSTTQLVFDTFASDVIVNADATSHFFITYDIGVSTDIREATVGEQVKAQVIDEGFIGTGQTSDMPINFFSAIPASIAVSSNIAGLSYIDTTAELKSIVPSMNIGAGMSSPVLQFKLTAEQVDVTLNAVGFQNTGTVTYSTSALNTDGITKIYLFQDGDDANETFEGEPFDSLVASMDVTGASNTSSVATLNLTTPLPIAADTDQLFYLVYEFGVGVTGSTDSSGNVTSLANANLNGATASADISIGGSTDRLLELSGTAPSVATPAAIIEIQDVSITLQEVNEVFPTMSVQGQLKVPMLSIKLQADADSSGLTVKVTNNKATFTETNNKGVRRAWLYHDKSSQGTIGIIDSTDELLSATTTFSSGLTAEFTGVAIPKTTEHYLLVAYDNGQDFNLTGGSQFYAAQLTDLTGGSSVIFGGDVPSPDNPTTMTVTKNMLTVTNMAVSTSNVTNSSATFDVTIEVTNAAAYDIAVTNVLPVFLLKNIYGQDISSEFLITPTSPTSYPATADASVATTFEFVVSPGSIFSNGTVFVDAFVEYQVTADVDVYYATNEAFVRLERYQTGTGTNDWQAASSTVPQVVIVSTRNTQSWILPSVISNAFFEDENGTFQPFENNYTIPTEKQFQIQFDQNGAFVDESSFDIKLNGISYVREGLNIGSTDDSETESSNTALELQSSRSSLISTAFAPITTFADGSAAGTFLYDSGTGIITLSTIGTESGSITLNTNDNNQIAYPEATFSFFSSTAIKIYQFLTYPNPYSPSISQFLHFGFGITKKATIQLFVFDSTGREVTRLEESTIDLPGNYIQAWDAIITSTGNFIPAGIYLVKLVATDVDGNVARKVTKLAVY
ncbi:hypothetical protein HOH87_03400 [bacterium]|nr:hypothetical protein [bacterium]